ncbi:Mu transposase C-terminal domain-containing protein, partial [Mesorhizobium sp. M0676]|uniref:Mu transposase C-terminal domain-containing protein n=1 Tax=Mesorhizobium sp. M0676 TaxID=2956984 RepID=UPI0033379CE1
RFRSSPSRETTAENSNSERSSFWGSDQPADIGRTKARLIVKYDPRDLSRVFVRRHSGSFVEARYADVTLAPITFWEAQAARHKLNAQGKREINMHVLVRTAVSQRELIEEAKHKTQGRQRLAKTNVMTMKWARSGASIQANLFPPSKFWI